MLTSLAVGFLSFVISHALYLIISKKYTGRKRWRIYEVKYYYSGNHLRSETFETYVCVECREGDPYNEVAKTLKRNLPGMKSYIKVRSKREVA